MVITASHTWEKYNKIENGDFPDGPVVKNLPCDTGDMGSIPNQGTKIPHVRSN